MKLYKAATVFIICSIIRISNSFTLRRHYRRPICEPTQTCSYKFTSFTFQLCDCPAMKECPMSSDHSADLKGITYQFCTQRELPVCMQNDISAEVLGIQTSIYCLCSDNMILLKRHDEATGNIQYVCKEKPICKREEVCGVGTTVDSTSSYCTCPMGSICVPMFTEIENPLANATCQML